MKFGLYKTESFALDQLYKEISVLRMFLYLLESSLFGILLMDIGIAIPLAIIAWPIAVLFVVFSFFTTLISLPYLLFVAFPLSLILYKNRKDGLLIWMAIFFLISWLYALILIYLGDMGNYRGLCFLPVHGAVTGFFMWGKLFGYRFKPRNGSRPPPGDD